MEKKERRKEWKGDLKIYHRQRMRHAVKKRAYSFSKEKKKKKVEREEEEKDETREQKARQAGNVKAGSFIKQVKQREEKKGKHKKKIIPQIFCHSVDEIFKNKFKKRERPLRSLSHCLVYSFMHIHTRGRE